jgi:hypothetical protein
LYLGWLELTFGEFMGCWEEAEITDGSFLKKILNVPIDMSNDIAQILLCKVSKVA